VRILVTGSRSWPLDEWPKIYDVLDRIFLALNRREDFWLCHGAAEGADTTAGDWAVTRGVEAIMEFPPDYATHGKRAPHVRNDLMLDLCDYVVAFWDGKSRGTKSVIDKAIERGLPFEVHTPAGVRVEI
jgi:hypothetical protein